jgi:shikimate dehydrogenase
VWALLDGGAAEVRVWNRTADRARRLAEELGARPVSSAEPADVLVNCTSIGLDDQRETFKHLPVGADGLSNYRCVVDLVYRARETHLIAAARAASVPAVEGIQILVGQGALSFEQFTGAQAPVDVMRAAVRAQ